MLFLHHQNWVKNLPLLDMGYMTKLRDLNSFIYKMEKIAFTSQCCEDEIRQGINLQDLQTVQAAQYQKNKQSKNGQKTEIDISPKKTYR